MDGGPRADANGALVTGPPRSGKTTAIRRTVHLLSARGLRAGGVYAPEIRRGGDRVGFRIDDVATGDGAVMAHVDRESGPRVGKYRVDVAAVDRIAESALGNEAADYLVVDEIAPMELHSEVFVQGVRALLDGPRPVVAAVKSGSDRGLMGDVKTRDDVTTFEVSEATRDDLPARLADWVAKRV